MERSNIARPSQRKKVMEEERRLGGSEIENNMLDDTINVGSRDGD